jgi:hypothetical protein
MPDDDPIMDPVEPNDDDLLAKPPGAIVPNDDDLGDDEEVDDLDIVDDESVDE